MELVFYMFWSWSLIRVSYRFTFKATSSIMATKSEDASPRSTCHKLGVHCYHQLSLTWYTHFGKLRQSSEKFIVVSALCFCFSCCLL